MMDTSDTAVGADLQQGTWKPISFFSHKMTSAETRYSTFDRELLAVYLAIKHFRHLLEGRVFHVLTDHKPLMYALNPRSDRQSLRQARHLNFISQLLPPFVMYMVWTMLQLMHFPQSKQMLYSLVNPPTWISLQWLHTNPQTTHPLTSVFTFFYHNSFWPSCSFSFIFVS